MKLVFSAVLLLAGGLVLMGTLAIDYMSPGGFWVYIGTQGIGFALILTSSALSLPAFRQKLAWAIYLAGSCGWLICWSWFLHLGLFIPIPLVFWAAISSGCYVMSAIISGAASDIAGAVIAGTVGLGSTFSAWVMALNPTFASDCNYIPIAVGAVAGGAILAGVAMRRMQRNASHAASKAP